MGFQVTPSSDTPATPEYMQKRPPEAFDPASFYRKPSPLNVQDACDGLNLDLCTPKSRGSSRTPVSLSSSSNSLLSDCSSLTSLPSLAPSPTGSLSWRAEQYVIGKDHELSAHCICIANLKGGGDQVACDKSYNDGLFYGTSQDGQIFSIRTWSTSGGDIAHQINPGFGSERGEAVRRLMVVNDRVYTSHNDFRIRIWERPEKATGDSHKACNGGGSGGAFRLVVALPTVWDCMAKALTPGGYKEVRRHHRRLWIEHADTISAMAVDAQRGLLYSASWDRSVKVWRLRSSKCLESFKAHDDAINALALSPDGRFLYTAAADGKIKVFTWGSSDETGGRSQRAQLVGTLDAHRSAVNTLALSSDGELLYSGACDKAIIVWERQENTPEHAFLGGVLRGHRQAVLCLASSSWGNILCSGSADQSIRIWQRLAGRLHVRLAVIHGHSAPVRSLALSFGQQSPPNSVCLALCSAALDHDIKLWQITITWSR